MLRHLFVILISLICGQLFSQTNGCECKNEQTVTVCYLPKDDFCEPIARSCEYAFDGLFMENGIVSKLENLSNFGANGTVDCEIEIKGMTDLSSVKAIEDCGCDMIFTGNFGFDTLRNYATNSDLTSVDLPTLNRIKEWSEKCENNLVVLTQAEAEPWGYKVENGNRNPNTPVASAAMFSIFDGPFGSVTEFNQGGTYQGIITQIPPTGAEVLSLDANDAPTVVIDNATNDLVLGDIGLFCSPNAGPISNGATIRNNNDILACNIFALACQIAQGAISSFQLSEVCPGETIILDNGQMVSLEGVYSDTLVAADGCDSIAITELKYFDDLTGEVAFKRCSGDGFSINVNGKEYNETNPIGQEILQSRDGCDSIVDINLEFGTGKRVLIDDTVCEGSGYFVIVGNNRYDESNPTGFEPFQSASGCDSIVDINLKFQPLSAERIEGDYCEGSGFFIRVNNTRYDEFRPTGQEVLLNQFGCDSTVSVDLNFSPNSSFEINDTYCQGDGSFVMVNNVRYDESKPTGQELLLNQFGCDSTVTVNLEFNLNFAFSLRDTVCEGSGYFVMVGNTRYDESNPIGIEPFQSASGCDSIIDINLNFQPLSAERIEGDYCEGSGFFITVNNTRYDEFRPTGQEVLLNQFGCDSTVSVDLNFSPNSSFEINDTYCQGDGSFVVVNNVRYDESKPTGQEVLLNQFGCDSTVTVNLEFNSNSVFSLRDTICEQSGFNVSIGNGLYDESNPTGQEVLINANNCDSTVNISLLFNPVSETEIFETRCKDDGFELEVNGKLFNELNPKGIEVLVNEYGCDSSIIVDLDFVAQDSTFDVIGVCEGVAVDIDGSLYTAGMSDIITYSRNEQCDSVYQFEVVTYSLPEFIIDSSIIVNSSSNYQFQNEIPAGYQVIWYPQDGLSCVDCPNPIIRNDASETEYFVRITDENNCIYEYGFPISYNTTPFVPSAFSPNNDGINDTFQVFFKDPAQNPKINLFQVYDRWGGLLYSRKDIDPFSSEGWWDGTSRGRKLNSGVFIYQIEIEYPNGEQIRLSGDVTLFE